ncbi:MAG TPA: hypothetical protein VK187_15080 [Geobacteraceae bacterium]|nr:hypothetical protein [Geobacteraceae bacterium]
MLDFMNSIGEFKSVYTLVDFYQYIKGVEYLICIAFFAGFPAFYRYIHKADTPEEESKH